jgi:hypothetical protein
VGPTADLDRCGKSPPPPPPNEIRSPDRPFRRESLYGLSYPSPSVRKVHSENRTLFVNENYINDVGL